MAVTSLTLPLRVLRRWQQRTSVLELALLIVFVALALVLTPEHVQPVHFSGYVSDTGSLWRNVGLTVLRVLAVFGLGILLSLLLSGFACRFRWFRRVLIPFLSVARAVPGLGLIGLMAFLLPVGWAIVAVAVFNMLWRITTAIMDGTDNVPPALDTVARGLAMTAWQRFWRVSFPVSIPLAADLFARSVPGVWFRLLGAEAGLCFIAGGHGNGIGAYALAQILSGHWAALLYALLACVGSIVFIQHICVAPLLGWAERYRVHNERTDIVAPRSWLLRLWRNRPFLSRLSETVHESVAAIGNWRLGGVSRERSVVMRIDRQHFRAVIPGLALAFFVTAVLRRVPSVPVRVAVMEMGLTFIHVAAALVLCLLIWLPIGLLVASYRVKSGRIEQVVMSSMVLFPVILLYPFFDLLRLTNPILLLCLGGLGLYGRTVLEAVRAIPAPLVHTAQGLGVKGILLWKRLVLPATVADIAGGLLLAVAPLWNAVIIAESLAPSGHGLGRALVAAVLIGDLHAQILLLMLLTLLSMLFDRLILQPIAVYAAQKYAFR
ncbi:ABC transporter permease subunit [Neokomagataea thailandica]|uniref:Transporter n=1 Tax=Neokomagataea tanensis NBRC 106556 TaxID=1223519 RepID=A0ABQ0QK90_9PROT|nr:MULTISPECIES: ABC transporter permease subunit [Neokomagataea]GBR47797.1 transporter [Neokomagataea tanensis NBRC 106556]